MSIVKGTLLLASAFLLAVLIVKPIGVSTQFVIFDGIVMDSVNPDYVTESTKNKTGYESQNAYLNKSGGKYAKSVADPINYSFVFVVAMMVGAFISSKLRAKDSTEDKAVPTVWREKFGGCKVKRYTVAFLAGILVLYGARLAGGCTSGHMMSGMMQTALSGYIFAAGAFLAALPVAIFTFKKKGK